MLKNKSLEDIIPVSNDELFSELTAKEASVIEGGVGTLLVSNMSCIVGTCTDDITIKASPVLSGSEVLYTGGAPASIDKAAIFDPAVTLQIIKGTTACGKDKVLAETTFSTGADQTWTLAAEDNGNIYLVGGKIFG